MANISNMWSIHERTSTSDQPVPTIMKQLYRSFYAVLALLILATTVPLAKAQETAPVAAVKPTELTAHDDVRTDDYFWLRDRDNPEVIAYLEAENEYLRKEMKHTEALQEELFQEIKGRIKQDDSTVPYLSDGYFYYTRYEDGKEYPIYCRKKGSLGSSEQIILDVNVLAEGEGFYQVSGAEVSPDGTTLAFGADNVGRRFYTLRFKDLATGEMLADEIPAITPNVAWANDNRTIFYTKQDPVTLRWATVYRHVLGSDPAEDELVFEETDDTFRCFVYRTKSDRYIIIGSSQTLSNEYRFVSADAPTEAFRVVQPRQRTLEYSVDHLGDYFYIRTNLDAENFRVVRAPVSRPGMADWKDVVPARGDVYVTGFELFSDYLVISERNNGLINLRVQRWDDGKDYYLEFAEPAYVARLGRNAEMDSKTLRFSYASMTTPNSEFDFHMETKGRTLLKQDEVLGGFQSKDYVTQRLYARARDGVAVPISIVYRRDTPIDGTAPLLLYAYGSYGASMDAYFSSARLSLLDRGFVYAIAHVRGGQELGRQWYENGKLLNKKNTFTDFVDCAEYLIAAKYANRDRVYAMGGSAGGLLMGAIVNMRPDLWDGVVAHVPWVDVITTMLDDSIPLTTSEYDEWGNPGEKQYYDYMLSYSPYDQVEDKDYPNMLVTAGLHDSQVQYWEPAKWVAKLRAMKRDSNRLLLKTNMEAGHGGASGRYRRYRETALDYAFLIDLATR